MGERRHIVPVHGILEDHQIGLFQFLLLGCHIDLEVGIQGKQVIQLRFRQTCPQFFQYGFVGNGGFLVRISVNNQNIFRVVLLFRVSGGKPAG